MIPHDSAHVTQDPEPQKAYFNHASSRPLPSTRNSLCNPLNVLANSTPCGSSPSRPYPSTTPPPPSSTPATLLTPHSKHVLNAQVSIRSPCCQKWFDCAECHAESETHRLAQRIEMVFACKKCKKCFRKDTSEWDDRYVTVAKQGRDDKKKRKLMTPPPSPQ